MKKLISFCFLFAFAVTAFAQKETFDLATYSPPKGWKKEKTEAAIQFSKEDATKGTYCLITLYKAIPGTADSKENFNLAWASIVKEMVTVSAAPDMQPASTENGWETQSGYAPFENDGNKGIVLLVTATAVDKMANLIVLTNTDVYEKEMTAFLESVSLKAAKTTQQQAAREQIKTELVQQTESSSNTSGTNANGAIIGTWGFGNNAMMANNRYGPWNYSKQQYTFNANGTYVFVRKIYMENDPETFLTKETGTYVVSGTTLTLVPKKNVIEAWSKKNGGDNYNKLVSSQSKTIERSSYRFYIYFDETLNQTALMLQASAETKRDGKYNAEVEGNKMWRYLQAPGYKVIKLPGE